MEFIEKHGKNLIIGFVAIIALSLVITLIGQGSTRKELNAQDKYFTLDDQVKKLKEEKFKLSQAEKDPKATKVSLTVDVSQLKNQLEMFISENPATVASQMAGLELSQILVEENKITEGLAVLQKVETKTTKISNFVVKAKIAQLLSDLDKCSEAISTYSQIIENKSAKYLHTEALLNQALCYKKLNNVQKAEEVLNQVKNIKSDNPADTSREAERILRLIQFNKSLGS